jgi:hypothetical protein
MTLYHGVSQEFEVRRELKLLGHVHCKQGAGASTKVQQIFSCFTDPTYRIHDLKLLLHLVRVIQ